MIANPISFYTTSRELQNCPECIQRMNFLSQGWNVWRCPDCNQEVWLFDKSEEIEAQQEGYICND